MHKDIFGTGVLGVVKKKIVKISLTKKAYVQFICSVGVLTPVKGRPLIHLRV